MNQKLQDSLESVNFDWKKLNVQEHWNSIENVLLKIIDELVPLKSIDLNANSKLKTVPSLVKNKMNMRKRLLKLEKMRCTTEFAPRIKLLTKSIVEHFANDKAIRVRSAAMGAKVNLWRAVNLARNVNCNAIPKNLTLGGVPVVEGQVV